MVKMKVENGKSSKMFFLVLLVRMLGPPKLSPKMFRLARSARCFHAHDDKHNCRGDETIPEV